MIHEIKIKEGIDNLRFGMTADQITDIMGPANMVEHIENAADEPTTVMHYEYQHLTLFLEGEPQVLACIDTVSNGCILFGQNISDLNERALVKLMVEKGYAEQDVEDEDFGERRVSFPGANIDFFYEGTNIFAITFGT